MKFNLKKLLKNRRILIFALVLIAVGGSLLWKLNNTASAVWFDDSWLYRKAIIITDSAAETNVYATLSSYDASDTTKYQSDCGDVRFTDQNGNQLVYTVATCGATTTFHINMTALVNGTQTIYLYYGNPGVANGFAGADPYGACATCTTGTPAAEEKGIAPLVYWKMDEGKGTTLNSSTGTVSATLNSPVNLPTWQTEDMCVSGKCLYFEGSNATASATTAILGLQSVSFWVKPASSSGTIPFISFSDGTGVTAITSSNLTLSAPGLSSPTYYVNGVNTTTLTANNWNHVVVTTASGFNATNPVLGKNQLTYFKGFMDEVKFYNYARTAAQVKLDFNSKSAGTAKGAGTIFGAQTTEALNKGLVGYWKMDESSGNAVDSSGNATTLTNNGTTTFVAGKYGNGASMTVNTKFFSTSTVLSNIQSVAFWINPVTTSSQPIDLNGTQTITISSGTITANNFTNPTIYVNGVSGGSLTAGVWQHILITSSAFNSGSMTVGKVNSTSVNGTMDEVRLYNRILSPFEIQQLYNFAPGPVGYWKMDENTGTTVNDTSGNNNVMTMSTFSWATGKYGSAFNGLGSNWACTGSGSCADDNDLDFAATDSFTISLWAKSDSATNPSNLEIVLAKGISTTPTYVVQFETAGKFLFSIDDDGDNAFGDEIGGAQSDTYDGTWHHFTAIKTSNTKIELYIDGKLAATDSSLAETGTLVNDQPLVIGDRNASDGTNEFNGDVDDVRIYNYARTPGQIIQDMNAGHPLGGSPVASQQDYWKFDEGYSPGATSSGIQRTTGTLTNMALPVASVGISGWQKAGKFGGAVAVDGINDYVDFGDMTYLETTGTMSASLWVLPNALATKTCLLCKYNNAATQHSWAIETDYTTAGKIRVTIPNATNEADSTTMAVTTNSVLTNGTWSHVAVVYDASQIGNNNKVKIYVNGVSQALTITGTFPSSLLATTSNMRAGASSDAARFFSGMIDEIKIYSGALSSADVLVDYNQGSSIQLGMAGMASNSGNMQYCVPGDTTSCASPLIEWNYEEGVGSTANDTSGNGYTGTINSLGTHVLWAPGKMGKGLKYDGLLNGTQTATTATQVPPTTVTFEAWINPKTAGGGSSGRIMGFLSSGYLLVNANNSTPKLRFRTSHATNGQWFTYPNSIVFNTWQHVAATYDASSVSNVPKIYINGVMQGLDASATVNPVGAWTSTAANLTVGGDPSASVTFDGNLDQIRVFNYIRTPAQIAWDYNRGLPTTWWKFDECQGTVAHDSVGTVSGTLNSGTAGDCGTASTAWSDGKTGKNNYSLMFGSAPDLTTVTSTSTYPQFASASGNISFGGWFKPTSSINSQALIEKQNQFRLYTDGSGNTICSIYYGGAYHDATSVTAPVALNSWNHVLCTYDRANLKTYVNGVLKNTTADTNYIFLTTTTLYLGQTAGAANQFTGQADDIKIWSYPLTAVQVRIDMNQGSAVRFGPLTGAP